MNSNRVTVEIAEPVITRIRSAVIGSDVEEGGKFLVKLRRENNCDVIRVLSYIDSGPRVSSSLGHLMPDANYQTSVFTIASMFDQDIDYGGSWHTHHCNGLRNLSQGDIQTYFEIVNASHYNLDYFFALLVTHLHHSEIQMRYYLFYRGSDQYFELHPSQIRFTQESFSLETVLNSLEENSFSYRKNSGPASNSFDNSIVVQNSKSEHFHNLVDHLKEIRIKDNTWIRDRYPCSQVTQRSNGQISWKWKVSVRSGDLDVCYRHPPLDSIDIYAHLEITFESQSVLSESIHLTDEHSQRFSQIESLIAEAQAKYRIDQIHS